MFVTKIWNASRFLLMNMEGYTPGEPVVETPADAWMFSRLAKAVKMVTEGIENVHLWRHGSRRAAVLLE